MQREEWALRSLCVAIAKDDIGGDYFNTLLLETGINLDDLEWEMANKILGRSEIYSLLDLPTSSQ